MPSDSDLLTLDQAAELLPTTNGGTVSRNTVWRWARHGCRGIRLSYRRYGDRIYVTRGALDEFGERLAELDQHKPLVTGNKRTSEAKPRSETDRQAAVARAKAELDAAGV